MQPSVVYPQLYHAMFYRFAFVVRLVDTVIDEGNCIFSSLQLHFEILSKLPGVPIRVHVDPKRLLIGLNLSVELN